MWAGLEWSNFGMLEPGSMVERRLLNNRNTSSHCAWICSSIGGRKTDMDISNPYSPTVYWCSCHMMNRVIKSICPGGNVGVVQNHKETDKGRTLGLNVQIDMCNTMQRKQQVQNFKCQTFSFQKFLTEGISEWVCVTWNQSKSECGHH